MNISKKLEQVLYHIDPKLLSLLQSKESKIDYLDISHSDSSKISYITVDRIKMLSEKYSDLTEEQLKDVFWKKSRYLAKPGKVMRKILPSDTMSDKSIQTISNFYKGLVEKKKSDFEVVSGYDIRKYFHYSTYERQERGTLAQSCMRHDKTQELLEFYARNKNIKMLILYSKSNPGTITGRSLLWDTEEGHKIMDRIYTIDSHYDILFHEWAIDNGYHRKYHNNWYNTTNFVSPDKKNVELQVSVKLKVTKNIPFPYLDTFKWLDYDGTIYNYLPKNDSKIEIDDGYLSCITKEGFPYKETIRHRKPDFKTSIKVLMNLDGGYQNYNTLLYDDIDKYYRTSDSVLKCSYLGIYTHRDRVVHSPMNNDYIMKSDYTNDKIFGVIFNRKNDKYNNKKYMMGTILDKVKQIYSSGYINNTKFEYYKKRFEELEKEHNKEKELLVN